MMQPLPKENPMFRRFRAKGFRNLEDLELDDLARVNLVAGGNGSGKTALLEALFLHCGAYDPRFALSPRVLRGLPENIPLSLANADEAPWQSLFGGFDMSRNIDLESTNTDGLSFQQRFSSVKELSELGQVPELQKVLPGELSDSSHRLERVLKLEHETSGRKDKEVHYLIARAEGLRIEPIAPRPPFPFHFIHARRQVALLEHAERFGKLEKAGRQDDLLDMLRLIEPRLKKIATVVVGGEAVLHGDVGVGSLVAFPEMGDGIIRLTDLALVIREAAHGVVLIDEIENGIHYSAMEKVWRALRQAAREQDVQLFATTHSFECITAAHRAFSEGDDYDFKLIRLERINEKTRAIAYDREMLEAAIEADLEVR
jgi:hypothetical protein